MMRNELPSEIKRKFYLMARELPKLGYKEVKGKKYLFVKRLSSGKPIFVNLRYYRVCQWEPYYPTVYTSYSFQSGETTSAAFLIEVAALRRKGYSLDVAIQIGISGCVMRWSLTGSEVPSGFCQRCSLDMLKNLKIDENLSSLEEINSNLQFCPTCWDLEQNIRTMQKNILMDRICEVCHGVEPEGKSWHRHHITYTPEDVIVVCPSCHGKIHHRGFPNPLWKERKPKPKPKKKKENPSPPMTKEGYMRMRQARFKS